jgi:hypothetical protein
LKKTCLTQSKEHCVKLETAYNALTQRFIAWEELIESRHQDQPLDLILTHPAPTL